MRKIAVITGSRADASPLHQVLNILDTLVELVHITTEGLFGHQELIRDTLTSERPDMVVLLGDRYETLVAASVAALLRIPIAHLAGGDITEGAVDDSFRHAITKLAYWHFPECKLHAQRILQMGESSQNVFIFGAPSVDLLMLPRLPGEDIEKQLGIHLVSPIALVCYHPETLGKDTDNLYKLANAIDKAETLIISGPNEDPGHENVDYFLRKLAVEHHRAIYKPTYSLQLWISLMHNADMLVGNSSAFISDGMTLQSMRCEAGTAELTIKIIGERQKGRYEDSLAMFNRELYPLGRPGTISQLIAEQLATIDIPETTRKIFHAH
jgi:UDP-hydrolysing UDP-N-acetyl-D-glucosamine 2-epimerase